MNNSTNEIILYKDRIKKDNPLNIWFFFAGPESFALSSLGYMWLYKELDECNRVNIERIYSDSTTSRIMRQDVNLIGISTSFDMDFLHVFKFFEKYGLNFKASERKETDPLIYAGGPVITSNPEPYSKIYDFMVIGDGEDVNKRITEVVHNGINNSKTKSQILDKLSKLAGIYVPKISKKVKKQTRKLSSCIYTPILSEKSYFPNTFIIETVRGCSNRCAFCLASYNNLPVRFPEFKQIIQTIELGLTKTNKIALLGAQVTAHPRFADICKHIENKIDNGQNIEMSISSLRVDSFTTDVVRTLVKAGQKTLTLAIEAGSERLRKVINKNLTNEQIFKAVNIAQNSGLKGIKLYGMIGIPTETMSDIEEIISLTKQIKTMHKNFDITFGFSTFVPKANTPFQWIGRENEKFLDKKAEYLKKRASQNRGKRNRVKPKMGLLSSCFITGATKI